MPADHPCHICGDPNAPWGFTWPGPRKDRPDDETLWGCAAHRHEVERINDLRTGAIRARPEQPRHVAEPTRRRSPEPAQKGLL